LTVWRMDSKIHASKLPAQKMCNATHRSINFVCKLQTITAALSNLKISGPTLLFPLELLLLEERKVTFCKQSEKSSSNTRLAENGQKRLFEE